MIKKPKLYSNLKFFNNLHIELKQNTRITKDGGTFLCTRLLSAAPTSGIIDHTNENKNLRK